MRKIIALTAIILMLVSCRTTEEPEESAALPTAKEEMETVTAVDEKPIEEEAKPVAEEVPSLPDEVEDLLEEIEEEAEEEPVTAAADKEQEIIVEEGAVGEAASEDIAEPEPLLRVEELESRLFSDIAGFSLSQSAGSDDTISFSGGNSSLSLRDGKEHVSLTGGASVQVGSMTISADEIELSGTSWRYVTCTGNAKVRDDERGISISTSSIWYDRMEERLLVSSWYEIEDRGNEVTASGAVLEYRMREERLQMDKDVMLLKASADSLMRCRAQSVTFSRSGNLLTLSGAATVSWKGNNYTAEVIAVDLNTDTITLEGRIRGDING